MREITDPAIVAAAELSHRYITDRFLPDKAIDLIDEAAARIKMEIRFEAEQMDSSSAADPAKDRTRGCKGREGRASRSVFRLSRREIKRLQRNTGSGRNLESRKSPVQVRGTSRKNWRS